MSPEELIPLYLNQVSKTWPNFDKEHFANRLNQSYVEKGGKGLIAVINTITSLSRNLI